MNASRESVLNVDGMTCMSCVRRVDQALRDVDGVGEVQMRFREGRVVVKHDPAVAPIEAVVDALREAGYPAEPAAP